MNEIGQFLLPMPKKCLGLLQVTEADMVAYEDRVVSPPGVYVQVVGPTVFRAPPPSRMTNVKSEVPSLLCTFQYVLTLTAVCPDGHVMEAMVDVLPAPIEVVRTACELGGDEEQSARRSGYTSISITASSSSSCGMKAWLAHIIELAGGSGWSSK